MSKQTLGKDDNNTFHPGKGKPSGVNKEEGLGLQPTDPEKMDEYIEVTEKYTVGEDELDPAVPIRHRNRNTSKGQDNTKGLHQGRDNMNSADTDTDAGTATAIVPEQLPGVLTKDRFATLANYKADVCISIFNGTTAAGGEVSEQNDPAAFKNQLQTVAQRLKERGLQQSAIDNLLEPGHALIKDDEFWKDMTPGLAIFIAEGFFKYIKMPVAPTQELVIEPTFYVTPLIPVMASNEYFYLLVISKQGCKLFKADAWGMQRVAVETPGSIEEVKRLSDNDATTYRSGDSGRRAGRDAMPGSVHGGGGGNVDGKDNLATYFEAVDDILWDHVFNKENAPLLLAGVEYEIPIYKSVCDYHNVWEQGLTGNREHQDTKILYNDAKEVMKPYFEQKVTKALETYGNQSATGLTSSIAADVIPAAYYAKISHLFVTKGEHIWGTFDEMSNELVFHDSPNEDGEDLIDNAVVQTLANGGEVFLLEKEKMPAECQIAALMRY